MNSKIDWLNHSLEFVVVLIGILIAFQLNTCSENSNKSELIDNHLRQISIECQENNVILETSIQKISHQITLCDSLLASIITKSDPISIRKWATRLLELTNVDISTEAYDVLVQSGDIRFLKNYDEKRNIISMYKSLDNIDDINQSNLNLYDSHFYPYIKKNFDLLNWNAINSQSTSDLEVYYSKEFGNIISTYMYLLQVKKRTYSEQRAILNKYLKDE